MKSSSDASLTKAAVLMEGDNRLGFSRVESDLSKLFHRPDSTRAARPSRAIVISPGSARPRLWPYGLVLAAVAATGALVGAVADDLVRMDERPRQAAPQSTAALDLRNAQTLSTSVAPKGGEAIRNPALSPAAETSPSSVAAPREAERTSSAPRERPRRQEARTARRPTTRSADCAGLSGAAEQRCAYPKLLAADRRLRRAYERAVEAKAPRQELVAYQRRWSRLRREARRDPERVARAYDSLAAELRQAARTRR